MTSQEELQTLMTHPRVIARLGHLPTFASLLGALREFGEPAFELNGDGSTCTVIVPNPGSGAPLSICGHAQTPANPSGAGLACLLALLEHTEAVASPTQMKRLMQELLARGF